MDVERKTKECKKKKTAMREGRKGSKEKIKKRKGCSCCC
jgi:hypothetical protein